MDIDGEQVDILGASSFSQESKASQGQDPLVDDESYQISGGQGMLTPGFSSSLTTPSYALFPIPDPAPTLLDLLQSSSPAIDFSNPSAVQYVDQLLSLSLHELLRQPQLISAESSTVESDLTNLCFREYPTFISVHKCSSAVSSAFDDFSDSLGKLIGAIPSLEDECKTFTSTTSSIQNTRGKATLVQEHQDKLLDLLELPQLMETCVRNGYYQEAMELLNHCQSLSNKYPKVALVQDVNREVEGILQLMLAQLLALLREPVKLPALVKTVSFLRRLDAMAESELGLVFISSRYHNFRAQLLSIDRDKGEPVRYLRKYIDLFREHVYDIIAQFTAIFLETSPSAIAGIHITSFANQAINDLVDLVTAYIPRISADSASMSSILVQLGYCAMSFSRVGLDFAPLISAPFSSTVLSTFSQALATASNDFSSMLRDLAKAVLPPAQILVTAEHIHHLVSSSSSPPPLPSVDSVSHYPPFATLVNAYLTAFNNLRLLAPLELHSQIISIHTSSLLTSTSVLLQYVTQATSFSDELPLSPVKSRPGHGRTASAPRADLLRRNSEVQMTPEARAAKRREAKRVCVASADLWCRMVVPFLVDKLNDGVFTDLSSQEIPKDLANKLHELAGWVQANSEGLEKEPAVNGNGNSVEPKTPPPRTSPLVSSPVTFNSPFSSSSKLPAIPHLATPTPKNIPPQAPHSDGIDAVFDSPQPSGPTENATHTSVPEPANLRESDRDTVENMEAQLEAMNIGLTGEEAAVAVEVKHASHHQEPHTHIHVNREVNEEKVKVEDDEQVKVDEVKVEEDAVKVEEVSATQKPIDSAIHEDGKESPPQAVVDESAPGPVVDESQEATGISHQQEDSNIPDTTGTSTQSLEVQDTGSITQSETVPQAVIDESLPGPTVNAAEVIEVDPLPSSPGSGNGTVTLAVEDNQADEETKSSSKDVSDPHLPATGLPESIVDVKPPVEENISAPINNGTSSDQQQTTGKGDATELDDTVDVPAETTPQPENIESTSTSADASRAPSPDATANNASATAPSTSSGNSKKKKKKKGKK
ncbi:hypothetical protein I203_100873 [Kwoniella mangroviensis CBS 8507]|uniref:uncharacterized protein n=1 Tax=Kwoniella mangroviensis CBS 8507 TaxID=1296122 RepID=UPI00080CC46E|nr:uncharacterized protein I203_02514 [Kwoniella mangroviensis CBS 8507]OCF67858.1 hypothetical protein I203_02514 [Kwoniella mangroviensis CBS 8507]